jgi:hypothetical protein
MITAVPADHAPIQHDRSVVHCPYALAGAVVVDGAIAGDVLAHHAAPNSRSRSDGGADTACAQSGHAFPDSVAV